MANAVVVTEARATATAANAAVITEARATATVGTNPVVITEARATATTSSNPVVITRAYATAFVPTFPVVITAASAISANIPPTISTDKATYDPGETVTITVADPDGTISSVVITGMTSPPTIIGSGGTRTFTAPPVLVDTALTVTATDNRGATAPATITIRDSGLLVGAYGSAKPAYIKLGFT